VTRDLFVAVYDARTYLALPFTIGRSQSLGEGIQILAAAHNAQADEDDAELETDPDRYDIFSWNMLPLDRRVRIGQVPRPGVLMAIEVDTPTRVETGGGGTYALAVILRQELERGDDKGAERFRRFISGPGARWRPLPLSTVDVFISFNPADQPVVDALAARFDEAGVSHVASPRDGREDARDGIASAALVLSVVSPTSVTDPWLLCEMGAAWALDRPILPALVDVEPAALPDIMAGYQSRSVASDSDRERLVGELGDFLTARLGE
jgi:hypothetical protein